MLVDENNETIHLKLTMHMQLPFPTLLFLLFYFRNAKFIDLNNNSFAQMLKDIHFFTYGLLLVNSVNCIKSTI